MEQVLSKGTIIARFFLIPFWQHSIHVHVYWYMYHCTVSLPSRAGLPPPAPYSILCVCSCVAIPATQRMKIVWLLINNCLMNILKKISRAMFYSFSAISAKDHIAAALATAESPVLCSIIGALLIILIIIQLQSFFFINNFIHDLLHTNEGVLLQSKIKKRPTPEKFFATSFTTSVKILTLLDFRK